MVSYGDIALPRRKGLKKWTYSAFKKEAEDPIAVENCLGGGCREDRPRTLLEVQSDDLRSNRHKLQQGKFQSGFGDHRNSSQWGQANIAACSSERLRISIIGNYKNVSEQGLKQTVPKLSLHWSGEWTGRFQEILPNPYHPTALINFNIITRLPLKAGLLNSAHSSPFLFSSLCLCIYSFFGILWLGFCSFFFTF